MNRLLYLIILLLLANLVATIWFGLDNNQELQPPNSFNPVKGNLPPVVSDSIRDNLFADLSNSLNSRDFSALYQMLGPIAKAQISHESAYEEFEKLTKYFHSIENGKFSHSEFVRNQEDFEVYNIYYDINLSEKSDFDSSAFLILTIAIKENQYQLYGFRIVAG